MNIRTITSNYASKAVFGEKDYYKNSFDREEKDKVTLYSLKNQNETIIKQNQGILKAINYLALMVNFPHSNNNDYLQNIEDIAEKDYTKDYSNNKRSGF